MVIIFCKKVIASQCKLRKFRLHRTWNLEYIVNVCSISYRLQNLYNHNLEIIISIKHCWIFPKKGLKNFNRRRIPKKKRFFRWLQFQVILYNLLLYTIKFDLKYWKPGVCATLPLLLCLSCCALSYHHKILTIQ